MSQEINLLNPALRPKHDWLSFHSVALGTGLVAACVLAFYAYASHQAVETLVQQKLVAGRLGSAQKDLQQLQAVLANRKQNPEFEREAQRLTEVIEHRRLVLQLAQETASGVQGGLADVMRGFSRQVLEGVWLTGFSVGASGIDIRGRLLDPSLLPTYIRKLNGEPSFRGRRFAALDMLGVAPAPAAAPASGQPAVAPTPSAAAATYTEFVLRSSALPSPAAGGKE